MSNRINRIVHLFTRAGSRGRRAPGERGVALIVTILVAVILGLLGMSMLSFSETEERVATTWRDEAQLQEVAKGGVRAVQAMFRQPTGTFVPKYVGASPGPWEYSTEANLNAMGIYRATRGARGVYSGAGNVFFKGPFSDNWTQVFGGTRTGADLYDLRYSCEGIAGGSCFLDERINQQIFSTATDWNTTVGKITEIRLYAPPIDNDRLYGYATVVVEATKYDNQGRAVAVQTVEAVLGNMASQPAIMADGNIGIQSSSVMCGNGCERIHANGNVTLGASGNYTGGEDATVSATGWVNTNGSSVTPPPDPPNPRIEPPRINPWDTTYIPTTADNLAKYYLMTTRPLDLVWTDGNTANNPAPKSCGPNLMCQNYQLDYDVNDVAQTDRGTGSSAYLYKWNDNTDAGGKRWVEVDTTSPLTIGGASFEVFNSIDNVVSGTGDAAGIPFNPTRVPKAYFKLNASYQPSNETDGGQGVTLLVDGCFWGGSSFGDNPLIGGKYAWNASVIAVGTIYLSSSGYMKPALANKVMLISGRDVFIESSFNDNINACPTPDAGTTTSNMAAVIAAHEQIFVQSSSDLNGILIAENEVNFDNDRDTNAFKVPNISISPWNGNALSIMGSAEHTYRCGLPPWPWPASGQADILSFNTEPQ